MSHEDNNVACKTTGEEQCLLRQKALSEFLVPQLVSQKRHPAKNFLSRFLPMFLNLFEVLKPIRCNLPLISQTVFYMSHQLVSFFLRFIFSPSNKVHTLTSFASICTSGRTGSGWKSIYRHCLLTYIWTTNRKRYLIVVLSGDSEYVVLYHFPSHDTWFVNLERSCWMYPNPVKRKAILLSQEWHHAPLPNHNNQFFSPSYHRTTELPPWL